MKIYVASSWRNDFQPTIVRLLRQAGHEVYDFRNPATGEVGFHWSEIDPAWESWTPEQYIQALEHPLALKHFRMDFEAMEWADGVVMVLPCGASAHFETGWATGVGKKRTAVLLPQEAAARWSPELMYLQADVVLPTIQDLIKWAGREAT